MSSHTSYACNASHSRSVRRNSHHAVYENQRSDRPVLQFYHSQAPMSSPDSYLGPRREMGPPPPFSSDFQTSPQPIEVNNSRTLPNPSASGASPWDSLSTPNFGGFSAEYGGPNIGRPLPVDNQSRTSATDPLQQWYTENDGPWIPKGISALPEERLHARARAGNRIPIQYGSQYRHPNSSDAGSFHYGIAPSDSGYGTRHSDGNGSVFSADINDQDQDCHSIVGNVADYHQFGLNEVIQQRDSRTTETWPPEPSSSCNAPNLACPTCKKPVKTRSELKKHDLRHRKPFLCKFSGCTRTEGFSTTNDLDRHTKSKHPSAIPRLESTKRFRCCVQGCKSKEKSWPRLDNFRSHLKRVHSQVLQSDEDFENMIKRAGFSDCTGSNIGLNGLPHQRPSLPDLPRAFGPVAQNVTPQARSTESNWKPIYPEVMEPPHDLVAPKIATLEENSQTSTPDDNASTTAVRTQETVQPMEVFRPHAETRNTPSSLGRFHLAPVGINELATKQSDQVAPQPVVQPSKVSAVQDKETRLKDVSASDATITEAIITALEAGAEVSRDSQNDSLPQELERSNLPNGKNSSVGSRLAGPHMEMTSPGKPLEHINTRGSPAVQADSKSLQEKKAREVLKTLYELGYIVQKDSSHSPKAQNIGSAASNKSENIVTCQTCKKFKGRPCELKKHMKRHSRPYGCTFLGCSKTFGSKNDWKRHENSQHFQLETWRCDSEKLEGGSCAKVCYRRQSFQDHLKKDHDISDFEDVKNRVETCRIGRNCQARFWCGFCTKLIDLTKKGVEAWTERFNHIDDHFMGRHGLNKQGIQDWIPVNSHKPKGEAEFLSPLDISPGKDSQDIPSGRSLSGSPNGNSPETSGATGGSPVPSSNGDGSRSNDRKRSRTSSGDERPAKHARTDGIVYCCQCKHVNNSKIDLLCSNCEDPHQLCSSCTYEVRPAGQDESSS